MKILKYGDGYPKTIICNRCKSELEYDHKDIYSWTDVLDELITIGIITCPVCGESVEVYRHSRPRPDFRKKKRWWEPYETMDDKIKEIN